MRRREFMTLLGGAAAAWPVAARAQQPGGMRRIGVLMTIGSTTRRFRTGTAAIKTLLGKLPADFKYEPGLVLADRDYVIIHSRYLGWGPKPMVAVLLGLAQLGWTDGRNVRIKYRWDA